MAKHQLTIEFEDPEPGDVTDPADTQALRRRVSDVVSELSEGFPFRFGEPAVTRLEEDAPGTIEVTRYRVSLIRHSGNAGDMGRTFTVDGAIMTRYEASGTILAVDQPGGVSTRFPMRHILEWTETQYATRIPVSE